MFWEIILFLVFIVANANLVRYAKFPYRNDVVVGNRAVANENHEAVVLVKLNNLDQLRNIVNDISFPTSMNYGKHLTRKELAELIDNQASKEFVRKYFNQHNFEVTKESRYGEYIYVSGSILQWETLLQTEFYEVDVIDASYSTIHRAYSYTIPHELTPHIEAIFRITQVLPKNTISKHLVSLKNTGPSIISLGSVTPELLNQYCKLLLFLEKN
jgi:tripeptidyl-peptidase-1